MAELLDGAVIKPGRRFSLNERVGMRTKRRGFVMAPSIGEGEMIESYGGGVSQLATTLYNALFEAGFLVLSHKPHTLYFRRYPVGIEATLSWPKPDLIFRNDTHQPLQIRVQAGKDRVTVQLFGDVEGRVVKRFVSEPFGWTSPPVDYTPDRSMAPDEEPIEEAPGTHGFRVKAGRDIFYGDGSRRHEEKVVRYRGRPRRLRAHPCKIPLSAEGHSRRGCPKPPLKPVAKRESSKVDSGQPGSAAHPRNSR